MFGFGKKESSVTPEQVLDALRTVQEPELHRDLVTLNMVRDIKVDGGNVEFTVVLTTPACPLRSHIEQDCIRAVQAIPGVEHVRVHFDSNVPQDQRMKGNVMTGIRNVIAVASGKGGVGKSTVATNIAVSLALEGARVGLLDADIYGPNIPLMMGVQQLPPPQNNRIIPAEAYGVKLMSIGFMVPPDQPIVWRGPMLHTALRQFLGDVEWGELDYLIVDMPPGTGDVQLSLAQSAALSGGVVVTTPQDVALADVRKGLVAFQKLNVPVLGIIENMSYFVCPNCETRHYIFGQGGGRKYAEEVGVPLLGEIPLDTRVVQGGDTGKPIVIAEPDSPVAQALREIARQLAAAVSVSAMQTQPEGVIGLGDIPVMGD